MEYIPNNDFTAVFVAQDKDTKEIKYINLEFKGNGFSYPDNSNDSIQELIKLAKDEATLYNLIPIDVCEIIADGNSLWNEA